MSVIIVLIACSLLIAVGFLLAYTWASRSGQYEDDYTPSVRMLFEDEERPSEKASSASDSPKTPND